jgi:bifunctional UDP-N-acetylglucosamine pyrophosphorylase/glucosamine-1-phosphate N-acetyltransferase
VIQQAVVIAAEGSPRLGQLTTDRPKSMLPVLGKPIMVRVMERLRDAGIKRFVVILGENEGGIAPYLSSSWYPDTNITFAIQPVPTGTIGALLLAAPHISGPFLLTSVDNLTSLSHVKKLIEHFDQNAETMVTLSLLSATPDEIRQTCGVEIDGERVVSIDEKPGEPRGSWASFTLSAFSKQFLDYLHQVRGSRDIISAIQASIQAGSLVTYVPAEWRLHLAQELDLLAINRYYLHEDRDTHILSEIPGSVHITPPVRIDPKVSVGQDAHIGPNVYLESGSTVGRGAVFKNSVVLTGGVISASEECQGAIVSRRVRFSEPQL